MKREKKDDIFRPTRSTYLENVLLAINDGEASTVVNESNVTSGEPALGIDGLRSVLLVLVVALEDSVTADPDLATGVGLVSDTVVHLGDIHQLELAASARTANVTRDILTTWGEGKKDKKSRQLVSEYHCEQRCPKQSKKERLTQP